LQASVITAGEILQRVPQPEAVQAQVPLAYDQ
jgi:hypothetical protein